MAAEKIEFIQSGAGTGKIFVDGQELPGAWFGREDVVVKSSLEAPDELRITLVAKRVVVSYEDE